MQKRKTREIIRVPIKYREKFLCALADKNLTTFTTEQKIAYANRAIRNDCINSMRMYESDSIMNELSKHCPDLVDEWDTVVKTHGEKY